MGIWIDLWFYKDDLANATAKIELKLVIFKEYCEIESIIRKSDFEIWYINFQTLFITIWLNLFHYISINYSSLFDLKDREIFRRGTFCLPWCLEEYLLFVRFQNQVRYLSNYSILNRNDHFYQIKFNCLVFEKNVKNKNSSFVSKIYIYVVV